MRTDDRTTPDNPPDQPDQPGFCFGCGPANPHGLHLRFTHRVDPETGHPIATAEINLSQHFEGPPGYIHGGIIATLLDEAMSKLNRPLNTIAMTRHMEIDYLRPAPLLRPLILTGRHLSRSANPDGTAGRKLFHQATLASPDGTIHATAKGLFITISASMIQAADLTRTQVNH